MIARVLTFQLGPSLCWLLVYGCMFCGLAWGTAQPQGVPLAPQDALRTHAFNEVCPLAFSPDGRWLAFVVRDNQKTQSENGDEDEIYMRTGVLASNRASQIWISNVETGETRDLTRGIGSNWLPTWSPDGKFLAFLSDRDGSAQARVWVWDSAANDLRRISDKNVRANHLSKGIQWTPDSRHLLVTTIPQELSTNAYIEKVLSLRPKAGAGAGDSPIIGSTVRLYEADSTPPGGEEHADLFNLDAFYLGDLAIVDLETGLAKVLVGNQRIGWFSLSPDGQRLAYAMPKRFYKPPWLQRVYDIVKVTVATGEQSTLVSDILLDDVFSWSPDGLRLAYGVYGGRGEGFTYYVTRVDDGTSRPACVLPYHSYEYFWQIPMWDSRGEHLYVLRDGRLSKISLSGGMVANFTGIQDHQIIYRISQSDGVMWATEDGKRTIVLARDEQQKQDAFGEIDLTTGRGTLLLERRESYTAKWVTMDTRPYLAAVSPDGSKIAYISEDAGHAADLWIADKAFRHPRQLTHLNPQFEKYQMGVAQVIRWYGDDGEMLNGALLLPTGYEQGRRYPLIVWVYPGFALSNQVDRFGLTGYPGPFNMQLFATRGYAVLLPDAHEGVGDRTLDLAKSVLPGVNKVVEMGIADKERIGVIGDSQGGYGALALVVETNRFKAAISIAGWGDFNAYYGTLQKDGASYQYAQAERQLGGTPWQHPMRYLQNSPFFYLDRVNTPVLIVHGSDDVSHPAFLADQVFMGLQRSRKRVEYARYQGETHVPNDWSYANQFDLVNRIVGWFDRFLKGERP